MKYHIGTICVTAFMLLAGSCNKDVDTSSSIVGSWELRKAQNGMIPTIEYSRGNGNTLVFSGSAYEKYVNGNLVKSGSYTIVSDDSVEASVGLVITPGQFTNRIIFDNDLASPKTFIEVSNDNLSLLSGYFPLDGGSSMSYQRIEQKH